LAKLTVKRIEIVALLEDSKALVDYLQRRGVVELSDIGEQEQLHKLSTASTVSMFEKYLAAAQNALRILDRYVPVKQSFLASFNGRRQLTTEEAEIKTGNPDTVLKSCYEIADLSKKIDETAADIAREKARLDSLAPWLGLDIPMSVRSTAQTEVFIGTLPAAFSTGELLALFAAELPGAAEIDAEAISVAKDQSCIAVICHKEHAQRVHQALKDRGFVRAADTGHQLPEEAAAASEKEIARLAAGREAYTARIEALAAGREDIEFAVDGIVMRIDKYRCLERLALTDKTVALSGYIPEREAGKLARAVEERFTAAVSVSDLREDETPPVLLKNNAFAGAVESVTKMYSLPGKEDIDPNPVMAFFYYCFFGIMLSDAGYGLVMVIAALLAKKKFELEYSAKKTVNYVLFCGIATVFWGAMFGSWFGDIIQVVSKQFFGRPMGSIALWFEPVANPMTMLLYAFLFGIIHLFTGLGVRFYMLWRAGRKLAAVLDVVPVYLLVMGAAPLGANVVVAVPAIVLTAGKYLAAAGALGVVLTAGRSSKNIFGKLGGGLYGLYNTGAGYLGDILSYSRLLALGLCTGVIANVINLLGTIPGNKVVKAVLLTVVFLFGHTVNIAINIIGAYVHTNRLHYVEFFSKFYEGGGRAFTPLSANTKYFRYREETNNA